MAPPEALPKVVGLFLVPSHPLFSWPFCRWLMLAAYSKTLLSCLANIFPIATCCRFFDLCRHYIDPPLSRNRVSIRLLIHDSSQNSRLLHKKRLTRTRPGRACVTILLDEVDLCGWFMGLGMPKPKDVPHRDACSLLLGSAYFTATSVLLLDPR